MLIVSFPFAASALAGLLLVAPPSGGPDTVTDLDLLGYKSLTDPTTLFQMKLKIRNNMPRPLHLTTHPGTSKPQNMVAVGYVYFSPTPGQPELLKQTTNDPPDRDGVLPNYHWLPISYYEPLIESHHAIDTVIEIPVHDAPARGTGLDVLVISRFRDTWTSHSYRLNLPNARSRPLAGRILPYGMLVYLITASALLLFLGYRLALERHRH